MERLRGMRGAVREEWSPRPVREGEAEEGSGTVLTPLGEGKVVYP